MKTVLKTIDLKWDLDYGETFTSEKNVRIHRSLIPELRKTLAPNFCPSTNQLTRWLNCLYKSQRSRNKIRQNGKIVKDKRRVHNNNRVQDVSSSNMICVLFYSLLTIFFLFRKKFDE